MSIACIAFKDNTIITGKEHRKALRHMKAAVVSPANIIHSITKRSKLSVCR